MIGSAGVGNVVAQLAFWLLILRGVLGGELRRAWAAVFVALWLGSSLSIPRLPFAAPLATSFVAALDIALVFIIFKGDVRIT